jgi:sugar lactone lactonase YvrE
MIKINKKGEIMSKTHFFAIAIFVLFFFFSFLLPAMAQTSKISPANLEYADDDFRRGVQSYYRGSYNDAILLFEKAFSYAPDNTTILDWLGKAYYRSGIEGTALQQWKLASNAGYGGLLLQNRINIVSNRRVMQTESGQTSNFVEAGSFPGYVNGNVYFSQPISVLPLSDGSCWVVAYGSNELVKMDVNGQVIVRQKGSLAGFDRPMDIIKLTDGRLLVSEYSGDRISVLDKNGLFLSSFGKKGCAGGCLLGPQYMALDSNENIFVSDFGNRRIDVFSSGKTENTKIGDFLFSFGSFTAPSGIAIINDIVYVADTVAGSITMYDTAGNYVDVLVKEKTLTHPEAMKNWGNYLLCVDGRKIITVDTSTGAIHITGNVGMNDTRLTSAIVDVNDNIIATDFARSELFLVSPMTELVGGMYVQIERINADNFPKVTIEVKVENRKREPVVGLKNTNFLVTEEKRTVAECVYEGAFSEQQFCDIAIILDRSVNDESDIHSMELAVQEIAQSMKGTGTLTLVSAGRIPVIEYSGNPSAMTNFNNSMLKGTASTYPPADLAIRLAANTIINGNRKRAIVFVTDGSDYSGRFSKYGLADISAYLNNNSIVFSTVTLKNKVLDSGINYITSQTPGESYFVYRPEGLTNFAHTVINFPCGLYQFSYMSSLPTDFGRKYLSVEIEAYLLNSSGRDETGYFAPLD